MTEATVAILIILAGFVILLLGYNLLRLRILLMAIGFYTLLSGIYAGYSNWLPQIRGEALEETQTIKAVDIETMPPEKLAEMGEVIIFGKVVGGNPIDADVGKGQCPLCHRVTGTVIRDRTPDLTAADPDTKLPIAARAAVRIQDPRYLEPNTIQTESYPGSGRATTAVEYIAESHACPHCFVVEGFGIPGTDDRESPMFAIHKPPLALTIEELIAVDTYLFIKDGLTPPSPKEIRAAYEKFIPERDRPKIGAPVAAPAAQPSAPAGPLIALATDTPEQIIMKMQCLLCHQIPTIPMAKIGVLGPLLIEGHNAPRRLASAKYKARISAGKAKAKTPREYVMESIVHPNAFIVPAFVQAKYPEVSPMVQDFDQKFTFGALEKLADFLLTLDCNAAIKDGLKGPPQEPIEKVCGPAGKAVEAPLKTTQLLSTPKQHERVN